MAESTTLYTLEEYRQRFAAESGYEYWFGEAVRKSVPTWLHAILQAMLSRVFEDAGYISGSELELRIDPQWEPKPDVAAALQPDLSAACPATPADIDIVAEVLSPDDSMAGAYKKCWHYNRIGIRQVFVLDPEKRLAWQWSREARDLERVHRLRLGNGAVIAVASLWSELDRKIALSAERRSRPPAKPLAEEGGN